jgi:protein-disulfide isomerase
MTLAAAVLAAQTPAAGGLSPLEAAPQASADAPSNALDKKDLEFYVRHLNLWGSHIAVEIGDFQPSDLEGMLQTRVRASYQEVSREYTFYVSKDGRKVLRGEVFDIAQNPFQEKLGKITTRNQPGFGKEGAPVAIVAYSDFQCPYCAKEAKLLRTQVREAYPEQVRVYFRDYPLANHNWSLDAAVAGHCIYQLDPGAFWAYHDWIFEQQAGITPQNLRGKVAEFASSQGLDSLKLSSCLDKRETEALVQESIQEGRALGITSTPTIFVNGRMLAGSLSWEQLKQIIDYEIDYQKVTHNAGDDCGCTVDLGSPVAQ